MTESPGVGQRAPGAATAGASTVEQATAGAPPAGDAAAEAPTIQASTTAQTAPPASTSSTARRRPRAAGRFTPGPDAPHTGPLRRRAVPGLAVVLVLLTGLAVFFGIADAWLRGTPSARNAALVDVGATAEAAGQLTDALETVYSYDFARLDENERAARDVITPEFGSDFDKLFSQVRELAPQRQAVVSATVQLSAIQDIEDDRAVLVAFMDQRATTAAQGTAVQQLAASGRLTVTGERVDGRWKIAGVESR